MFPGLAPYLCATNDLLTRRVTRFPKERALSLPEYLSFPGLQDQVVWASEDATTKVIGAIDWDAGVAVVEPVKDLWEPLQTLLRDSLRPSLDPHKDGPEGCFTPGPILPAKEGEGEVMISLAELLALVSARSAGSNGSEMWWFTQDTTRMSSGGSLLEKRGQQPHVSSYKFWVLQRPRAISASLPNISVPITMSQLTTLHAGLLKKSLGKTDSNAPRRGDFFACAGELVGSCKEGIPKRTKIFLWIFSSTLLSHCCERRTGARHSENETGRDPLEQKPRLLLIMAGFKKRYATPVRRQRSLPLCCSSFLSSCGFLPRRGAQPSARPLPWVCLLAESLGVPPGYAPPGVTPLERGRLVATQRR